MPAKHGSPQPGEDQKPSSEQAHWASGIARTRFVKQRDQHAYTRAQRCSNLKINRELIAAAERLDIHAFVSTVEDNLPQMNIVNLCTALHRLAKLSVRTADHQKDDVIHVDKATGLLLSSLERYLFADDAHEDPSQVSPQGLSNIMWSLATLGVVDHHILKHISHLTLRMLPDFKLFELASLMWAAAKMNASVSMTPLFPMVAEHLCKLLAPHRTSDVAFRTMSTLAWAYAKANQPHRILFARIAPHMSRLARGANSQELANAAWAFATVGYSMPELMATLQAYALERAHEFNAQEVSNMLWAFGTLWIWDAHLFESFIHRACCVDLLPQHVANILWACCQLQPHHPITQDAILMLLPRCASLLSSLKPKEAMSLCAALSKALRNSEQVPQEVQQMALQFRLLLTPWLLQNMPAFSNRALEQFCRASAFMNLGDPSVLHTLETELVRGTGTLPHDNPRGQHAAGDVPAAFPMSRSVDEPGVIDEKPYEELGNAWLPRSGLAWVVKNTFVELLPLEQADESSAEEAEAGEGHRVVRRRSAPACIFPNSLGLAVAVAATQKLTGEVSDGAGPEEFCVGFVFASEVSAKLGSDDETDSANTGETIDGASTADAEDEPLASSPRSLHSEVLESVSPA